MAHLSLCKPDRSVVGSWLVSYIGRSMQSHSYSYGGGDASAWIKRSRWQQPAQPKLTSPNPHTSQNAVSTDSGNVRLATFGRSRHCDSLFGGGGAAFEASLGQHNHHHRRPTAFPGSPVTGPGGRYHRLSFGLRRTDLGRGPIRTQLATSDRPEGVHAIRSSPSDNTAHRFVQALLQR